MLIVTSVLLLGTIIALFFYYKRIRLLRYQYDGAKRIVDDIVLSINSQFRRQKDRVLFVTQKMEKVLLENKKVENRVNQYKGQLTNLTNLINNIPQIKEEFSDQLKEVSTELASIKEAQNKLKNKLIELEKNKKKPNIPELKIEAAIPIKKEKALAPLTETELSVLETIGKEGEKTAPEIREKIGLTREHTARLMKKLYKDGYMERDTHKMPYVYRLKEEMQKILKKRETSIS
jgi:DNA-binding MarR family transcriptional regulator